MEQNSKHTSGNLKIYKLHDVRGKKYWMTQHKNNKGKKIYIPCFQIPILQLN